MLMDLFRKKEVALKWRIEQIEPFNVVGVVRSTTNKNNQGMKDIPKFWREFFRNGMHKKILEINNCKPVGLISLSLYNVNVLDPFKFDVCIGCATTNSEIKGTKSYHIPGISGQSFSV